MLTSEPLYDYDDIYIIYRNLKEIELKFPNHISQDERNLNLVKIIIFKFI
jgi:hypothetical protein